MKIRNLIIAAIIFSFQFAVLHSQITVFTIGDSTMAPRTLNDNPENGWGMALPLFFDSTKVKIDNHARSGRSTKSFIDEGRWRKVVEHLKAGDYVFIQFGHNDEKSENPKLYAAPQGAYRDNLTRFVRETQEKGAFPVLMTSIIRRKFDQDGILTNTHGEYPDAVRSLAKELNVPLIDMEVKSRELVQKLGDVESKKLFMWFDAGVHKRYPNGRQDDTHLNVLGAQVIAGLAVEGVRELNLPLAAYLLSQE